ncbi:NAMPT [Bugula neritina]|uniref:Nicotinamide phosphoribosyltransferase n=1 Tax=Bugula neritina TaxID=10212 RepID=A0A7J7JSY7_BUGNE|nr:NAMPT [Bugula neritina]
MLAVLQFDGNFPVATDSESNIILLTDSYKITHHRQYPPNTTLVYSYFESRGHQKRGFPETCFFGLQYLIKRHLLGPVVTQEKIDEAREILKLHFGDDKLFNEEGWQYILKEHDGHLPVRIKAVPEGSIIPEKNVLITVENTDPKCFWLTNYLETLLVQVWYPMTVCTNSRAQKKLIGQYLEETADNLDGLSFKLHDFGFRGSTSVELFSGLLRINRAVNINYHCQTEYYITFILLTSACCILHSLFLVGSTITSWGKENEADAYRNMLTQFPTGLVAVVSDSYDVWHACRDLWGDQLKSQIEKRNGTLVVRPDSGVPHEVVISVLEILGKRFGFTYNSKGFKVLPPYIRIIQGDGISFDSLGEILQAMKESKWSADNVAYGSGGALLQRMDRDTQKCAFKCSYAIINGKGVEVYKDPVTDSGKKSKKGQLTLEIKDGKYVTMTQGTGDPKNDILTTVFENGKLLKDYLFNEVRANAEIHLIRKGNDFK